MSINPYDMHRLWLLVGCNCCAVCCEARRLLEPLGYKVGMVHLVLHVFACDAADRRLSNFSFSSLFWIPQELILFDNCNLNRKIDVNLYTDSNFLLSEASLFGRTAMNENLEKGFFFDNWRIYVEDKLIHAEALSLSGDIKNILSGLATAQNNISICNIFLYGKEFLKNEMKLIKTIEGFNMKHIAYSSWNDKMLIRIISNDAYHLKKIQKKILLCVSNNTIPKVWNN